MNFKNPEFLSLIVLLPFLFYFLRKRKNIGGTILFTNFLGMRSFAGSKIFFPLWLDILAVLLLIIALARPVSLEKVVTPPVHGKDIMVALDISTSMEALDFEPNNRLGAAKSVIAQFVEKRTTDRLGLVFFAKESFLQVPLTTDYSIFMNLLAKIETRVIEDGTAIGNGIGLALSRLEDSKTKSKIIILLTDGDNNSGNLSPESSAELAKKYGIKIYTILIGTNRPVKFPAGEDFFGRKTYQTVQMKVNPELLKNIAEITNGKFYQSISTEDLKKAFADIDRLEKSIVPAKKYKLYSEFAPYFIYAAIFLILLARLFALRYRLYPEVER